MKETPEELEALQRLMDRSYAGATPHLQEIVADDHRIDARRVVELMVGMKVLSIATVTAKGEPRISAVDGHFLHGTWTFGTDGRSAKARHLEVRPAVSLAHVDGEHVGVFAHGVAHRLSPDDPGTAEIIEHWAAHYGSDPFAWGDDVRMYRLEPTWLVGYAGADAS